MFWRVIGHTASTPQNSSWVSNARVFILDVLSFHIVLILMSIFSQRQAETQQEGSAKQAG